MTADSGNGGLSARRRAFLPAPTLPLVHIGCAHVALALALAMLAARPEIPGASFYHPKALALVHLVTLGWISGSILGALYIVAPLALGIPLPASRLDAYGCLAFWVGTTAIAAGFWMGRYELVAGGALLVLPAIVRVGLRVVGALPSARLPLGVSLHVGLAFANVLLAVGFGLLLAVNRRAGIVPGSPMALAAAHAHLALLGWAGMMIVGIGYRLIPMVVPAAMPSGAGIVTSAVLLEAGTVGLAVSLATGGHLVAWAVVVAAAFASFLVQIARILGRRRPRPADLPRPDWSTWQTLAALACLLVAAAFGMRVAVGGAAPATVWAYATVGVLGFAAQMVLGIAGRLLPMQAWYRALLRRDGVLPSRSVHLLIEPRLACAVLILWVVGLPLLTVGLASQRTQAITLGAAALLGATVANAWHAAVVVRRA